MTDPVHDLSSDVGALARTTRVAEAALGRYRLGPGATVELINVSENATYRIDDPDGPPSVLRLHRSGYHSPGAIESELAWMEALRQDTGIRTPVVLSAADGARVIGVPDPDTGRPRACVRFEFLPGAEPDAADRVRFVDLGALTARMHAHARTWDRPIGFTRFAWDADAAFGGPAGGARWGRWQDAAGVGPAEFRLLSHLEATLRHRLERFGCHPEHFGLIHADTRLANLLVDGDEVSIIDFDDCGFSWYLYDLATVFSFIEHRPEVPDLIDAWLSGYRSVSPISTEDEAEIWTFILYRRLLLLAWLGSHTAADITAELSPTFATNSCTLAEQYLHHHDLHHHG
jgi:Ser/Thr protein kinase RdoA (MazF antagonist)